MSSMSWLNYLNEIEPEFQNSGGLAGSSNNPSPHSGIVGDATGLGDDLRRQLEAWTTVTFEDPTNTFDPALIGSHNYKGDQQQKVSDGTTINYDPSPYAKRPFGYISSNTINNNPILERGFNSFSPNVGDINGNDVDLGANVFMENLLGAGIGGMNDGSNILFPGQAGVNEQYESQPAVATNTTNSIKSERPVKRARKSLATAATPGSSTSGSSSTSPAGSHSPLNQASTSKLEVSTAPAPKAATVTSAALITKAAILAAQAAELAAKKTSTPEEEAARQAELVRIATEDDKRRRNTAASARFRVKKKQREAALEDTIKEMATKVEKLEKELEATKVENNFLRNLVIKKVGIEEMSEPNNRPRGGKMSGGQEGATGMGTNL